MKAVRSLLGPSLRRPLNVANTPEHTPDHTRLLDAFAAAATDVAQKTAERAVVAFLAKGGNNTNNNTTATNTTNSTNTNDSNTHNPNTKIINTVSSYTKLNTTTTTQRTLSHAIFTHCLTHPTRTLSTHLLHSTALCAFALPPNVAHIAACLQHFEHNRAALPHLPATALHTAIQSLHDTLHPTPHLHHLLASLLSLDLLRDAEFLLRAGVCTPSPRTPFWDGSFDALSKVVLYLAHHSVDQMEKGRGLLPYGYVSPSGVCANGFRELSREVLKGVFGAVIDGNVSMHAWVEKFLDAASIYSRGVPGGEALGANVVDCIFRHLAEVLYRRRSPSATTKEVLYHQSLQTRAQYHHLKDPEALISILFFASSVNKIESIITNFASFWKGISETLLIYVLQTDATPERADHLIRLCYALSRLPRESDSVLRREHHWTSLDTLMYSVAKDSVDTHWYTEGLNGDEPDDATNSLRISCFAALNEKIVVAPYDDPDVLGGVVEMGLNEEMVDSKTKSEQKTPEEFGNSIGGFDVDASIKNVLGLSFRALQRWFVMVEEGGGEHDRRGVGTVSILPHRLLQLALSVATVESDIENNPDTIDFFATLITRIVAGKVSNIASFNGNDYTFGVLAEILHKIDAKYFSRYCAAITSEQGKKRRSKGGHVDQWSKALILMRFPMLRFAKEGQTLDDYETARLLDVFVAANGTECTLDASVVAMMERHLSVYAVNLKPTEVLIWILLTYAPQCGVGLPSPALIIGKKPPNFAELKSLSETELAVLLVLPWEAVKVSNGVPLEAVLETLVQKVERRRLDAEDDAGEAESAAFKVLARHYARQGVVPEEGGKVHPAEAWRRGRGGGGGDGGACKRTVVAHLLWRLWGATLHNKNVVNELGVLVRNGRRETAVVAVHSRVQAI